MIEPVSLPDWPVSADPVPQASLIQTLADADGKVDEAGTWPEELWRILVDAGASRWDRLGRPDSRLRPLGDLVPLWTSRRREFDRRVHPDAARFRSTTPGRCGESRIGVGETVARSNYRRRGVHNGWNLPVDDFASSRVKRP